MQGGAREGKKETVKRQFREGKSAEVGRCARECLGSARRVEADMHLRCRN